MPSKGPAKSIVKPSPELKNTFNRGLQAEELVLEYYLKSFLKSDFKNDFNSNVNSDYELVAQRLRTPFAEVDLLLRRASQNRLYLVEVKSVANIDFLPYKISEKQKARLGRALLFLVEKYGCAVEVHWAFVDKDNRILVIDEIIY